MTKSQPDIAAIQTVVQQHHLDVLGVLIAKSDDPVPKKTKSIVLLGPREPGFWHYFTAQPEYTDSGPDPLDRWSARVISALAAGIGGTAIFPFGGPPFAPFTAWALRTGRAWPSPVTLLVHDTAGLLLSFRGAICLPYRVTQSQTPPCPCHTCNGKPCVSACPVNALTPHDYDLDACHGYLQTKAGRDCLDKGCAARRACPISQSFGRLPDQSAHHMRAFHP